MNETLHLPLRRLEQRLGVSFRDKSLVLRALTHKSFAEGAFELADNQRLEFLGDAVLQLAVSHILYDLPDEFPEGDLTSFRSHVVSRTALTEMAKDIGIANHVRVGKGLRRNQPSIMADCVEALLGALFIDQSFAVTHRVISSLIQKRLQCALAKGKAPLDAKSRLQQLTLAQWNELPRYDVTECVGDNPALFTVRVFVSAGEEATGTGHSKKAAEQDAALHMLDKLSNNRVEN